MSDSIVILGSRERMLPALRFAIFAAVQFVVLTFLAMTFYAGGTGQDSSSQGYHFLSNFFSDLGLTMAHNGQANTVSLFLFALAFTVAGLGLIVVFVLWPKYFSQSTIGRVVSLIGSVAGVASGLLFIGVALTPADIMLDAHIAVVVFTFVALTVAAASYTLAILLHPAYPNVNALPTALLTIIIVLFLFVLLRGDAGSIQFTRAAQVGSQTLIFYSAVICFGIEALTMYRFLDRNESEGQPSYVISASK